MKNNRNVVWLPVLIAAAIALSTWVFPRGEYPPPAEIEEATRIFEPTAAPLVSLTPEWTGSLNLVTTTVPTETLAPATPGLNCGEILQTPYGDIQIFLGDQEEILVAAQFGRVLQVHCDNGIMFDNGPAASNELDKDTVVYFATGNQCTASRDGLGVEWLDVYASGRHLAPAGQVTYSRCEYFPATTATP